MAWLKLSSRSKTLMLQLTDRELSYIEMAAERAGISSRDWLFLVIRREIEKGQGHASS